MKWLFLLRGFFPSWRFFVDVGPDFKLQYRTGELESDLNEWFTCIPKIKRNLKGLLVNPMGNVLHAYNNHLHHLVSDLNEKDVSLSKNVEDLISYRITDNLVRYQIREKENLEKVNFYQFRVAVVYPKPMQKDVEYCLVSPVYNMRSE